MFLSYFYSDNIKFIRPFIINNLTSFSTSHNSTSTFLIFSSFIILKIYNRTSFFTSYDFTSTFLIPFSSIVLQIYNYTFSSTSYNFISPFLSFPSLTVPLPLPSSKLTIILFLLLSSTLPTVLFPLQNTT